MKNTNKVVEIIAEELLRVVPKHEGPFISSAEARRVANYDNENRFAIAERIATRIDSLYFEKQSANSAHTMQYDDMRNIISDAMDKLAMALVDEKDVDVADHVNALFKELSNVAQSALSEEEIMRLWYDHAGAEHNGGLLNLMTKEGFKAAIKELNQKS